MSTIPQIPGYSVHNLLGKGGMATVYLATQDSLGRKVAIKVLSDFGDPHAEARFFSEARTIAGINHPRIVTVYDVAHLPDGRPYLSMEYVAGGDLTRLKGQTLGETYALELIRQVAEGLGAVHRKGIIHRDIKPANILFREDHSVALSDFGIAKDTNLDTDLTQAGMSVGSPSYSSPEQIYGQSLDQRSDLYSLGVVLLELLSGSNPYKGENYAATVINHTERPLPDLSGLQNQCQDLLRHLLARDPEQRFASTDALIEAIDRILSSHPDDEEDTAFRPAPSAAARTATNAPRSALARHWFGRRQQIMAGAAVVALALIFILNRETETDRQINALLEKAQQSIEADQLIAPEFDNARYYYSQILTLEPGNGDAEDGLENVDELLVERHLHLAAEKFEQGKLYRPLDNSAVYHYRQALALDEDNDAAREGLQRVQMELLREAQAAFNQRLYGEGMSFVQQGLDLDPENEELLALQEKYKDKVNKLQRFLKGVFNRP